MTMDRDAEDLVSAILEVEFREAVELALAFAGRARAAVLTEEDRRVWCERHAHYTANSGMGSSGAVEYANAELNRYREARAAWDARKEKG